MVGSAAALAMGDVITCQYQETGVFQQRGYTLKTSLPSFSQRTMIRVKDETCLFTIAEKARSAW
jgi:hypothetical protein